MNVLFFFACDETSHRASCREDSGNSGLVPFHAMHNHDDRDEDENRGNPYPNHLFLDEDVVGEEAINSFNDRTPLDAEDSDCIIDGGDEWYGNTEREKKAMAELGPFYLGMGVSGDEEGARHGPSLMPGGSSKTHRYIEDILLERAAQVSDNSSGVTYIGRGGSGIFIKMVQNGIEYGDM